MAEWLFLQETATAGNGGGAMAAADGGAAALGDVHSGDNSGSAIGVGDTVGDVSVHGGLIANTTNVDAAVLGGTAMADASGGGPNVAATLPPVHHQGGGGNHISHGGGDGGNDGNLDWYPFS